MPIYDFLCAAGHQTEQYLPTTDTSRAVCPYCSEPVKKIFTGTGPTMIPDSIPGGLVLENLTPRPKRYYSRTEIKDEMRARGVEQRVRHVGEQGSDRSKQTQRWV